MTALSKFLQKQSDNSSRKSNESQVKHHLHDLTFRKNTGQKLPPNKNRDENQHYYYDLQIFWESVLWTDESKEEVFERQGSPWPKPTIPNNDVGSIPVLGIIPMAKHGGVCSKGTISNQKKFQVSQTKRLEKVSAWLF